MTTTTTTTTRTLSPETAKLALRLLREMRAAYAEYLEACDEDRRNSYRPHYCEHGANMWVDYDCACGACEMGYTHSYGNQIYADAIAEAKRRHESGLSLIHAVIEAQNVADKFPGTITVDWKATSAAYSRILGIPAEQEPDARVSRFLP